MSVQNEKFFPWRLNDVYLLRSNAKLYYLAEYHSNGFYSFNIPSDKVTSTYATWSSRRVRL